MISEDLCETFQCKKSNEINVCNNTTHIQMIFLINSQKLITMYGMIIPWVYIDQKIEINQSNVYIYIM